LADNRIRKKRQYRTLLSVLASGSTPEARRLLKNTTGQDCFSETDLEEKLARLYAQSSSKIDLEKEFAHIHPHKDFILKYCQVKMLPPQPDQIDLGKLNTANTNIVEQVELITPPSRSDIENPTEGRACTCGCGMRFSNAEGEQLQKASSTNLTITILGLVSIVAIVGTILYLKHEKR
jgi:hypothetical protein